MSAASLATPRGSLVVSVTGDHVRARFECDAGWLDLARDVVARIAAMRHPALGVVLRNAIENDALDVVYARQRGATFVSDSRSLAEGLRAVADVADGLAAVVALPGPPIDCGPFPPWFFVRGEGGGELLVPGLWPLAYASDRGMRGHALTLRHFIESAESLRGVGPQPTTPSYHIAYALFTLFAGREPFPQGTPYSEAVLDGASVSLAELRPNLPRSLADLIDAALRPDPAARPTLVQLARSLRSIA